MPDNNETAIIEQNEVEYSGLFSEFIEKNTERIKEVSEKFSRFNINGNAIGFVGARKRVIAWLRNFDLIGFEDFNIALVLLEQFMFVDSNHITAKLSMLAKNKALLNETMVDTYITHLGEVTESSYRVTSHFNSIQNFCGELSQLLDDIEPDAKIKILFFDDFLNSGGQIITIFYSLLNKSLPEGFIDDEWSARSKLSEEQISKLQNSEIHIFYYLAFDEGIENFEKSIKEDLKLNVKIHKHSIANMNNGAFGDSQDQENILHATSGRIGTDCSFRGKKHEDLSELYKILKEVGKKLLDVNEPKWDNDKRQSRALGYGNICRLISTDYNIPSITITALWHSGKIKVNEREILWNELLPRRKKILKIKKENKIVEADTSAEDATVQELIIDEKAKILQQSIINFPQLDDKKLEGLQYLLNRFLALEDNKKIEISQELQIYDDKMNELPENERNAEIFLKVVKQQLMVRLLEKLETKPV